MNQFTCEHPKKVLNPYTKEWLYVSCGKCSLCRSKKAAQWTERLEIERGCHPFCLFGTLTYSEEYLPKVYFNGKEFLDSRSGELVLLEDISDYVDNVSLDYIRVRGFVPVGDVRHVQNFIKRLREKVRRGKLKGLSDSTDRPESRYLRYFLVCELSPTSFRPHYHFIIFTGSSWFANHAKMLVDSCWRLDSRRSDSEPLGITDVQNVQTSASAYVSAYVNSYVDCPRIFQYAGFRPFKIFSKHSPIGTLLPSSPEVQALFDSGSVTMSVYRRKQNEFVEVPIPKGLCSRLYPKVTGFDRFSTYVLSGLYCNPINYAQISYETFRELFRRRCKLVKDGLTEYFKYIDSNLTESESAYHYIFSCLRRVDIQSTLFGVSRHEYFNRIVSFYRSRDYKCLCDFYKYYEDYTKENDCRNMLLNDRLRLDFNIKSFKDSDIIYPEIINELKTYGYDESVCTPLDFLESISPNTDINFVSAVSKANKCINDSRKKKAKNEYLLHRNMNYQLKDFLLNYHGLSKYNEGDS